MLFHSLTYAYNKQVRRPTATTAFSLAMSRKPPGSLMLLGTRLISGKYGNLPPQHVKMKIVDCLHHLIPKAGKKSTEARRKYKLNFNRRVRYTRQLTADDIVYVVNPLVSKPCQNMTSTVEDPSFKLRLTKSEPYRVVQATPHTVTINIYGLHNIVAIDRVALSQAALEINQDASGQNCDEQFPTEYKTMPKEPQAVEPFVEKRANATPENGGSSPSAPEDAV